MKPSFAIVDWDMFVRPICCYVGPDEIPRDLMPKIARECRKSRYDDVMTPAFVKDWVARRADADDFHIAETENDPSYSAIRIWTYSDPVLSHELLHVIENVCAQSAIVDEEFKCYAMQWLLCDFRCKLTGRFDKPFHFRRGRR